MVRATVAENQCNCHPETCCCYPYRLLIGGEFVASGSRERLENLADAVNWATPPAPDALLAEVAELRHYRESYRNAIDRNVELRGLLAAYESDALRLAREAVAAMDAADDALAAGIRARARTAEQLRLSDACRRADLAATVACIAAVRALPSGAAVQGEADAARIDYLAGLLYEGGKWQEFAFSPFREGVEFRAAVDEARAEDDARAARRAATPLAKSDGRGAVDPEAAP